MEQSQQAITSLKLVPFRDVLENVVQEAHASLQQLTERLPALGDEERKRALLLHLQTTRQRLQRLHVCAQWAHKAKAVNTCREVLKAAADHGAAFVHAADELFRLHEELRFGRAPLFDVSTALHILQSGTYRLLPAVIEEELQQPGQRLERPGELSEAARAARRRDALRRLDFLLRSKLLASELPAGLRVVRVRGGQAAVAAAGGQYTALLTLVPSPRDDVTLTKYRPPGEADEAPASAAPKEDIEVTQPTGGPAEGAAAVGADQPSTSAAPAAAAGSSSAAQPRQGTDGWRWQLISFELLPAAAGRDPPPMLPQQRQWLQQHIEQRMWAAADVEQLVRLDKQAWVTVPQPAAAKQQQGQAGKATSAPLASGPAPSSSLAPSQPPAAATVDSKGKQAAVKAEPEGGQLPEQQQTEEHQEQLPVFATDPLAAMHAILCQTAGRLALFSLLLSDARQLEGGSWKGGLKLSRSGGGSGIRLAYWQQLPCVSYPELQCLREGTPYQPESPTAATAGAPQAAAAAAAVVGQYVAPAVEVALRGDGGLAASSSPQLHHPLTGEALSLHLPLDSAHSFSADRLLLQAAAHTAGIQLAAVQAALQRGGRLAPAGIHSELALAASSAATACGQLPASPMLQLWHAGSLQLSVSVQLRSGRLLLAAGPALLESEQGGAAAAAAAATQQQLDQLHRGAMVQPLPTGASRGMLAVQLAADALARLSLQLSMQRRMDAAAAAAAAYGLRRASLPGRLLQQHLQHVALLLAPLSGNTLTLALPAHPPPSDLAQWACQQRQRRQQQQGGGSDSGATRCFMLLDFGETPAVAGQQQQQEQDAAVSRQPGQALRVLLAACACTSRGTPTRVLQVSELPPEELREMQQEAAAPPVPSSAASRKRRASDAAAPAAGGKQVVAATGSEAELGLAAAVAWCKRQSSWAALKAQLLLIPAQHGEELGLTAPHRQALLLPKLPGFAQLEPWAAARLGSCSGSSGGGEQQPIARPAARLQLEEGEASGGEMGAWRVHTSSLYFAHLRRLLQPLGVTAAPPAPDAQHMATTQDGLELRYSLQTGHSVVTALTDLVCLGQLHACLTHLADCMAANPLAAGTAAAVLTNGGLDALTNGQAASSKGAAVPNGQLLPSNGVGAVSGGLVWPLPGCGSVRLAEAGLTHLVLLVAPPPLPEGQQQHQEQSAPLRVTVCWTSSLGAAGQQQQQPTAEASSPSSSGGGSLGHVRCRVSTEPQLPEPTAVALAQQLGAGRADLFLDGLCLTAHSAATAAQQLAPEAQRSAGLLPRALRLLPVGSGGSSTLRLRGRIQQGDRSVALALGFHAAGYTLLQLQPTPSGSAAAAAWLPQLWQRLQQQVPSFAAVEAAPAAGPAAANGQQQHAAAEKQQLWQAWVHTQGLGQALAALLQAVAAPSS